MSNVRKVLIASGISSQKLIDSSALNQVILLLVIHLACCSIEQCHLLIRRLQASAKLPLNGTYHRYSTLLYYTQSCVLEMPGYSSVVPNK